MHDIIALPPDYNVALNFEFLKRSPKEILHSLDGNSVYKLLRIGRKNVIVRLEPLNDVFVLHYPDNTPTDAERLKISQFVKEWFDLENDLTSFYEMAAKDRVLRPIVEKYRGYRIVGMPDLFESLCWAIIGQQINLSFAYTLKQRFVEKFGTRKVWHDKQLYLFPSPEVVAALRDEELLALQFSRQKSVYVRVVASAFCEGVLSKKIISQLDFQGAKEKLLSIKGIGNWTANYALMKTFRYKNAFPLEDAGVHNAIRKLKDMDRKPTLDEVRKFYKNYKGWEAYATLYLWKTL